MTDRRQSQTTGLAGRYAAALFDLAEDARALEPTEAALARVKEALSAAPELVGLIAGRRRSRAEIGRALEAVAAELALPPLVRNFLGVVAGNGRAGQLPEIIAAFERRLADWRGETTAEVTVAHALSNAQEQALLSKLKARTGRDMRLDVVIEPAILGGLVVRIGSEQIDTSVRTRLERLGARMKG